MTRRSQRLARALCVDLSGLDKRQQRRAVRRAATQPAAWTVFTYRRLQQADPLLKDLVTTLSEHGYGTLKEVTASLAATLRAPVESPLELGDTTGPTDGLLLDSLSLFTKKGFNAGNEPDAWLEYCDEHQVRYPTPHEWNRVLARLVWRRLLPVLPAHVEVNLHDTRQTNPVRALRVDGRPVHWTGDQADGHYFESVILRVPWRDVADELETIR